MSNDARGILNWTNPHIRYEQTRNAIEEIKRKILAEHGIDAGWLESCGPSAFSTEMEGLGYLTERDYLHFPNGETIQMDDAHTVWLNDPHRGKYPNIMDNRRGDVYVDIARQCYGCKAYLKKKTIFDDAAFHLWGGDGVQVCLKSPGHWIALIAFDRGDDEIVFHDSWGNRPGLKNGGTKERLTREQWSNVQPTVVIYPKKGS